MKTKQRKFGATASRSITALVQNNRGLVLKSLQASFPDTNANTFYQKGFLIISFVSKVFCKFYRSIVSWSPCSSSFLGYPLPIPNTHEVHILMPIRKNGQLFKICPKMCKYRLFLAFLKGSNFLPNISNHMKSYILFVERSVSPSPA